MLTTSKIAVSVAIVLGVAPLLFVQVVYDPFWYTSNVLSAWWVMGFIGLLIAGYIALYIFYWKNHDIEAKGGQGGVWLVLSLGLLLAVGFIVHSLTNQMLFPENWMGWYAPQGVINPNGQRLHYWNLPRYGFFIALSAPVKPARNRMRPIWHGCTPWPKS
jgi:vacuolar-type H+-ATPase subunit I/STV1